MMRGRRRMPAPAGGSVARNIEIKARARDFPAQTAIATRLADGPPVRIEQEDTFFHVPHGRLKLRQCGDGSGELIQYEREDAAGPKTATYRRVPVPDPGALKDTLAAALGVRTVVRKTRTLLLVGRTRVHLDEVAGLGCFLEIEVVLGPEQSAEDGAVTAKALMAALGIAASDRVAGAYADLALREASG
jgi:adenylate cyclase class IV